ncbi:hypothetical protein TIFTF001_027823 [Ficus carica]|uniref:Uncharacterized protein n=1 Tax=Ficus carica TaxID=3494 RepID=A0AA88IZ64_FICCA|nr:hypothetical protein TIFTF001_027823 [Ficus carica]
MKKIQKSMGFLTHKLKMEPSIMSRHPSILLYSLEKRIIPRTSVMQLLRSKGVVKDDIRIIPYLRMTEKNFVQKIVSKYQKKLPDVVKAHQGKIEFQTFPGILV